jgi:hypothetical protein
MTLAALKLAVTKRAAEKSLTIHRVAQRDWLVLVFVLVVAAVVRFNNPQSMDWSKDHSDMAMLIENLRDGKGLFLVGQPSSARIPHSAFYVYPLIIPYVLSDGNVVVTTMFVSLISLVAVATLWFMTYRYFGATAAFIAGLAYAVNPWDVGFSRSIWSGDHRAAIVLIGLLLGIYGFAEGKRWAQVLCFPVLLTGLQIHLAGWVLIPLLFPALLWLGWGKTSRRALIIGVFLGLLTLVPYAIGFVQMRTADVDNATAPASQPPDLSLRGLIKPYGMFVWVSTGLGAEQYTARANIPELRAYTRVPMFIWAFLGVAVALGIIGIWRYAPPKLVILIYLWAFGIVLAFTVPLVAIFPHYLIPSSPAYALFAGIGGMLMLDWLKTRLPIGRIAVGGAFALVFVTQAIFDYSSVNFVDTYYTPSQFGSGTPIHYLMNVVDAVHDSPDVVIMANKDWLEFSRTSSWVFAPFLHKTAHCLRDVVLTDTFAVLPQGPFAAVFVPRAPQDPTLDALYRVGTPTQIPLRQGEGEYTTYHINKAIEWPEAFTRISPARFDSGVQLTGYRVDEQQVTLEWQLPAAQTQNYRYTITLLDTAGKSLAETDGDFWPSKNWCAGDKLVSWKTIDQPGSATTLRIGMSHINGQTVNITGADGKGNQPSLDIALSH